MSLTPGIIRTPEYEKYKIAQYTIKYSLDPLILLKNKLPLAQQYVASHPDNAIARWKLLGLEKAIAQYEDEMREEEIKEALF